MTNDSQQQTGAGFAAATGYACPVNLQEAITNAKQAGHNAGVSMCAGDYQQAWAWYETASVFARIAMWQKRNGEGRHNNDSATPVADLKS